MFREMYLKLFILATIAISAPRAFAFSAPVLTETILSDFKSQGLYPSGALAVGPNGAIYGVALSSNTVGVPCRTCGLVFMATPPAHAGGLWTVATLYQFGSQPGIPTPTANGDGPDALVLYQGNLYGTTGFGGQTFPNPTHYCTIGCGTVFKLILGSGPVTYSRLHTFLGGNLDGIHPQGNLLVTANGIFGTVSEGAGIGCGGQGCGGAYMLTQTSTGWTSNLIYSFLGGADGSDPEAGLAMDSGGSLYGTTNGAGVSNSFGTVFRLSPNAGKWTETVLHSFVGGQSDGSGPSIAPVILNNGSLYGTTLYGGTSNQGTIYSLTPPAQMGTAWTEAVVYSFNGSQGAYPYGGVIFNGGNMYGTTSGGGATGSGVVFELTESGGIWMYSTVYMFGVPPDGATPQAPLVADVNGVFYGTTAAGGTGGDGVIFSLTQPQ